MKKVSVILFFLFSVMQVCFSQTGVYRGIVYRYNDGEPLANASIFVDTAGTAVLKTDHNGFFNLQIKSGEHTIRIQAEGTITQARKITVKKDQVLSERVIVFSEEDQWPGCDSLSKHERIKSAFLKYTDSVDAGSGKVYIHDSYLHISNDGKMGLRSAGNVIVPLNDILQSRAFEVKKLILIYNGLVFATENIVARAAFEKIGNKSERPVVIVRGECPPWSGEGIKTILEISSNGKTEYLESDVEVSIRPVE